ncbi:TPA: PTS transporter subunit EIIA, partial [Aeromonas hydrophila]|nr:PTS transporter subunit EIIA [Aeromonas hydrophila]
MLTTLIDEGLICLDLAARDKQALFVELAARLKASGKIASQDQFVRDLWAREELDNTGFEQGVALPHAKSEAVREPAIVVGISRQGIDYGAEDGEPSKLFFMIASPAGGANHHIEVLAELSTKLLEPGFIASMQAATSRAEVLALLAAPGPSATPVAPARAQPAQPAE